MNRRRKIAEIPAGSWTKRLVVGFWVAVGAVAYPLPAKPCSATSAPAP
jgi:hypothetical protein